MAPTLPSGAPTSGGPAVEPLNHAADELDDIFADSADAIVAAPGKYSLGAATGNQQKTSFGGKDSFGLGLGLDEEVEVTRKIRVPRVKLDEERLLSAKGIPELRRRAKGFKSRGKGCEFKDMERLLTLYQLWLDDLFPKAKFLDALAMVEKTGHKRRMQVARQGYIDERRPKAEADPESRDNAPDTSQTVRTSTGAAVDALSQERGTHMPASAPSHHDIDVDVDEDGDIYGATPMPVQQPPRPSVATRTSLFGPKRVIQQGTTKALAQTAEMGGQSFRPSAKPDDPLEDVPDDLDALLAEAEISGALPAAAQDTEPAISRPSGTTTKAPGDSYDDDMEALADMGMW